MLLTIVSLAIVSCHPAAPDGNIDGSRTEAQPSNNCQTIEHEMGETEICNQPEKIVALGPFILETLLTLDIQPIGFADHFDIHHGPYDNPSQQIPYLGERVSQVVMNIGSADNPSLEAIAKIQPDLIVGTEANSSQYLLLSEIAPTVLLKWGKVETSLKTVGEIVGRSDIAAQSLVDTEQLISEARSAFSSFVRTHPKVLLLSSFQLNEIRLADPSYGLCRSLLGSLNFQLLNLSDSDNAESVVANSISVETLPQFNDADITIILGYNFSSGNQIDGLTEFEDHQLSTLKQAWESNQIAQSLTANMEGKVYFIPAYICLGMPGIIGTSLYLQELKQQILEGQSQHKQ